MATATNGIATRANCNTIASGSFSTSLDLTKCPTKAEIIATGKLKISGSYDSNQCVHFSVIQPAISLSYRLTQNYVTMYANAPEAYRTAYTRVIRILNGVESDVTSSCSYTAYFGGAEKYIAAERSAKGLEFYFSDTGGFLYQYPYDSTGVGMIITHSGNSVGTFSVTVKKNFDLDPFSAKVTTPKEK